MRRLSNTSQYDQRISVGNKRMEYREIIYLCNFDESRAAQSSKRGIDTIMRGAILDFEHIKLMQGCLLQDKWQWHN